LKTWYKIILVYGVFAISFSERNIVIDAPSIGAWMKGCTFIRIKNWVSLRNGTLEKA